MKGWSILTTFVIGYDLLCKKSLSNFFYEATRKRPILMAVLWGYLTVHLWFYAQIRKYDPLSRGRHLVKGEP